MELKKIKELMALMGRHDIRRIVLKEKNFEIELEAESHHPHITASKGDIPPFLNPPTDPAPIAKTQEGIFITSPMVGTFYASASPDDAPFVKVGDRVDSKAIVCIIEAMKVMNEVKAGLSGTVAEKLVEDGHPVEFGTKLFRVT